jgi:class 3 adenylate cyclase
MEKSDGIVGRKGYVTKMSPLRHCIIGKGEYQSKNPELDLKRNEVVFSNKSESYCISIVDIVGSTQITSKLYYSGKIKKFYTVFINEIANIVKQYDGRILKTVGDGVIFFFPQTSTIENIESFKQTLECLLQMVSSRQVINSKLRKESLPDISYRISADYGKLEVAMSGEISSSYDLFGPTINFCAKMNRRAPPNGIAIGADLWRIINSFPRLTGRYHFQEIKELSWKENRYSYPVYLLKSPTELLNRRSVLSARSDSVIEPRAASKDIRIMLIDDENGFELYQQLMSLDPNLRVIFVTALDIAQEITTLLPEVKLSQFIIKPVNPSVLINSVKQHASRHIDGV